MIMITIKNQNINNSITKNLGKKSIILMNFMYETLKYYSSKNYVSNNYKSQVAYVGNNLYKRFDNITLNTNNISKNLNRYTTDVVTSFETNRQSPKPKKERNII